MLSFFVFPFFNFGLPCLFGSKLLLFAQKGQSVQLGFFCPPGLHFSLPRLLSCEFLLFAQGHLVLLLSFFTLTPQGFQ